MKSPVAIQTQGDNQLIKVDCLLATFPAGRDRELSGSESAGRSRLLADSMEESNHRHADLRYPPARVSCP
jgi:hypothetical protein